MIDRASAEGLRAALDAVSTDPIPECSDGDHHELQLARNVIEVRPETGSCDHCGQLAPCTERRIAVAFVGLYEAGRAALRDTGPRPDSGIDDLRALFAEPHHLGFALSGMTGMYDTESVLIKRDWYERLRACLSTPRTETSE